MINEGASYHFSFEEQDKSCKKEKKEEEKFNVLIVSSIYMGRNKSLKKIRTNHLHSSFFKK
jgi:hypothetical protein